MPRLKQSFPASSLELHDNCLFSWQIVSSFHYWRNLGKPLFKTWHVFRQTKAYDPTIFIQIVWCWPNCIVCGFLPCQLKGMYNRLFIYEVIGMASHLRNSSNAICIIVIIIAGNYFGFSVSAYDFEHSLLSSNYLYTLLTHNYLGSWLVYGERCHDELTVPLNKMSAISPAIFSSAFFVNESFVFLLNIHLSLFLRFQLMIIQYWCRRWPGADQETNHYIGQWWLDYRRI